MIFFSWLFFWERKLKPCIAHVTAGKNLSTLVSWDRTVRLSPLTASEHTQVPKGQSELGLHSHAKKHIYPQVQVSLQWFFKIHKTLSCILNISDWLVKSEYLIGDFQLLLIFQYKNGKLVQVHGLKSNRTGRSICSEISINPFPSQLELPLLPTLKGTIISSLLSLLPEESMHGQAFKYIYFSHFLKIWRPTFYVLSFSLKNTACG